MFNNDPTERTWWEKPWVIVAAILFCSVPLLWPYTPPLTDYPGHIGRYSIDFHIGDSPYLREWYRLQWDLIPNLGVDILMNMLHPFIGGDDGRLETAAKLIAVGIALTQGAGLMLIARQAHGRIPPTAYFALAVIFTYPFNWGFANFSLSIGLSFLAFALWMGMENRGKTGLRSAIFVPLSIIVWVCHIYGWAVLGVLVFADTITRPFDRDRWMQDLVRRGLRCTPLLAPMVLKLLWPSNVGVLPTTEWFDYGQKIRWVLYLFRDSYMAWDLFALVVCVGVVILGVASRRFRIHRGLALAFAIFSILFAVMPTVILGSDYADMRLLPTIFATGILMIGPMIGGSCRTASLIAAAGLAFFVARTSVTAANFIRYDREFKHELAVLDHVPVGAKMITFFDQACRTSGLIRTDWRLARMDHLDGIALARRQAYAPGQWTMIGGQPLRLNAPPEGLAGHDRLPPLRVTGDACAIAREPSLDYVIRHIPARAFDYLWIINEGTPADKPGWKLVWKNERSGLYRAVTPAGKPISG
jgi:hypothetical protein